MRIELQVLAVLEAAPARKTGRFFFEWLLASPGLLPGKTLRFRAFSAPIAGGVWGAFLGLRPRCGLTRRLCWGAPLALRVVFIQ